MTGLAEVAVGVPVDTTFHYTVPASLLATVAVGCRVTVPFGRRRATGWVIDLPRALPADGYAGELREVLAALDDAPLLSPAELDLYRWMAEYYRHPLGLVLKTALPAGLDKDRIRPLTERVFVPATPPGGPGMDDVLRARVRAKAPAQGAVLDAIHASGAMSSGDLRTMLGDRGAAAAAQLVKKGILAVQDVEVRRMPAGTEGAGLVGHEPLLPPALTGAQCRALAEIEACLATRTFSPILLQGVTGSGKTEVYLRAIRSVLEQGRSALVLVPEIALTPQLVGRFRARFGEGIAVLHSGLSDGQRFDEWRRLHRRSARIAVGARSAVFAPLSDLGIVVVDEEHDGSYKQEDGLRYHARDVAVVRAQRSGAVVVLGSATPSLETFQNALSGRYRRLILPERVGGRPLPPVEIVRLTGGRKRKGPLTDPLRAAIEETLDAGKQTILFLNRRGYAPSVVCEECGDVHRCEDCSVAMIFHAPELARRRKAKQGGLFGEDDYTEVDVRGAKGWLTCHYCGRRARPRAACPECSSHDLRLLGIGTQRLERELGELFPRARVARMDRDTTSRKGSHEKILERLAKGEIDILLGTQMITKGIDFPGVTLVGVVLADTALNLADFRAAERTFQLLTQVAGRAGRGNAPGKVIVQTFFPSHYAVARAATHDFEGFAERELESRRELFYPPFARLVNVRLHGPDRLKVERAAHALRDELVALAGTQEEVRVVGPAPAPLAMLRGRHRWQILIRAASPAVARRLAVSALRAVGEQDGVRIELDVDPQSLL